MGDESTYEEMCMKENVNNDSQEDDHIYIDDNEAYVCVTPPPLPSITMAETNNDLTKASIKMKEIDTKNVSKDKASHKTRLQFLTILVIAVLLVAVVTCVIAAFIEVGKLKSEMESLQQESSLPLTSLSSAELTALLSGIRMNINHINGSVQDLIVSKSVLENRVDILESTTQMVADILNQFPLGQRQSSPAASCAAILEFKSASPSGFYWIRSSNGSGVQVYCDMTRTCGNITGGWMRVADLNMTDGIAECPPEFTLSNQSNLRTCRISQFLAECTSIYYSLNGVSYSHACGMIRAYQVRSIEAFERHAQHVRPSNATIDSNYVDGISLTYGTNPRQHIWTFAASCPCDENRPQFIGNDFFCDGITHPQSCVDFCSDIVLWDGLGCSTQDTPWFYRNFLQAANDDIELRVCHDEPVSDEDIAIEIIDIYVQ